MSDDLITLFAKRTDGNFGQCVLCKRRSAESESGHCRACAHLNAYEPAIVTTRQVANGARLLRASSEMLKWPWPGLHQLTGPIMLGHVVYVVAASGIGKTTFSLDLVRRWLAQDIGLTVLPLETTAQEWRLSLAAITAGINHGDVFELISRLNDGDPTVADELRLIESVLMDQAGDARYQQLLHVVDDQSVTVDGLDKAFTVAKAMGHKVVLVDHIDHVGAQKDEMTGRTASGLDAVKEVNNAVLSLAKYHNLAVVAMSQANMSYMGDGTNPLLRFKKLEMKHVLYNSLKIPNASQILGIYRPLRAGLTRAELATARDGSDEPSSVLAPGRMKLSAMKLRHRGRNEGNELELAYERGTLRELTVGEREYDAVQRALSEPLSHSTMVLRKPTK